MVFYTRVAQTQLKILGVSQMVNIRKLKDTIAAKNYSIGEISEYMGIDRSTFYRKLYKNGENFTVKEVTRIMRYLELTPQELAAIFFADNVA